MITVLLATYNGEEYISDQIQSLLNQSVQDLHIVIQDDFSCDGTWGLISRFQMEYPNKITIKKLKKNTGNAKHNFYSMMANTRDEYLMLSDQDDVWLPDKIERTHAKICELERLYGKETPLLVHSDLRVVDKRLNVINPSFRQAMNANYNKTKFCNQIIQNTLTGCTCIYNRALAELIVQPEPDFMVMHDWWLMLVASAFGRIGYIDDQTILYRQHDSNEIGAKDVRTLAYIANRLLHGSEIKRSLDDTYRQADSFLNKYRNMLSHEQIDLLEQYCDIPNHKKIVRWMTICRLGTLKNGMARKIAHFIYI